MAERGDVNVYDVILGLRAQLELINPHTLGAHKQKQQEEIKQTNKQNQEVESEELTKLRKLTLEFEKRKRDNLRHQLKEDLQWRENIGH